MSSSRASVTPLLSYYARQGMWGHLEHETNKMLSKGLSDSSQMNWWRAMAQGFIAMESSATGTSSNVGEALRELSQLKQKRDLELASMVALLHFHKCAERLDVQEIDSLEEAADREVKRASDMSLLLAARFHWYAAIHSTDGDLHRDRLSSARELISRVAPPEIVAQTGMQKQAHALLAWVEMSIRPSSRPEQDALRAAIRYLDRSETRDLDTLMAKAKYYEVIDQHKRALDELHQAVALQSSFAPALLEKAKLQITTSEWDQARESIERVLALNERNTEALRLQLLCDLTQAHAPAESVAKALQAISKSLERYEPRNASLHFSTARTVARLAGRRQVILDATIEMTAKAVRLRPGDSEYVAEMAHQLALKGDFAAAARANREAGENDEANITALYGGILCQIMSGDLEDAAQQLDFLAAVGDSIEQAAQLPYLKALLAWRKDADGAAHASLLEQAERLHFRNVTQHSGTPRNDAVYAHFARLDPDLVVDLAREYLHHVEYEVEDFLGAAAPGAASTAGASAAASPPTHSRRETEDTYYGQRGNGDAAAGTAALTKGRGAVFRGVEILERLSGQVPGLVEAQLLVGKARFAMRQYTAAQRSLAAALALDEQCAAAHLLAARISLAQRNFRAAAVALEQAVACDFTVRTMPMYLLASAQLKTNDADHDEALTALEQALRLPGVRDGAPPGAPNKGGGIPNSERAAIFVELAGTLTRLRQFEEASAILAEAHERFKGTADEIRVLMANSELAIQRDDFEAAVRMLNGVPQTSPAYIHAQMVKANFYLQIRHDKRAYTQCYRDLVGFDQSAASYERLGAAYMRIQAPEAAIEAYEQAHHINPRDAKLAAKIGRALVSTHDYLKAREYYVTALQAHSDDIDLRHDLARLFMKLKRHESAVQVLTYALDPEHALGAAPAGGDGAAQQQQQDLPKMVQDVKTLQLLAEVYKNAEDHAAAVANEGKPSSYGSDDDSEDRARRGQPNMTMPDHSVSQTLLRARELQKLVLERARREMESSEMMHEQKQVMAAICRSLALFFVGEVEDKAVKFYEEALDHDQTNKVCMVELARLELKRGRVEACEAQCGAVIRLDAKHAEANMLLADVLFLRQEYDDATAKFRDLLEATPHNYAALAKLIKLLRRAGKLDDVAHFIRLAEKTDLRALSHAGLNYCKGLRARFCNDVIEAVKFFNLARRDGRWGVLALMNMIELYLNPDNEALWADDGDGGTSMENSEASLVADQLFRELKTFEHQPDLDLKIRVLGAYIRLASRTKANVDEAMQIFIDILETEKDYLPALLGMSTAFMLEKAATKARNALKRIAKMPYDHELADDFERGYLLLADIYIQKSKFDLAEDLCMRCLKYNQSCGRAWETMGSIREKEASYKDAADMYEKAWKLEHEASATVGFKLAFNYLKAKRFVEAIDICNRVLSLYPDYPKIRKEILDKAMDALRP